MRIVPWILPAAFLACDGPSSAPSDTDIDTSAPLPDIQDFLTSDREIQAEAAGELSYTVSFNDSFDPTDLTIAPVDLPAWLTWNASTASLSASLLPHEAVGTTNVDFDVSSASLPDGDRFTLSVKISALEVAWSSWGTESGGSTYGASTELDHSASVFDGYLMVPLSSTSSPYRRLVAELPRSFSSADLRMVAEFEHSGTSDYSFQLAWGTEGFETANEASAYPISGASWDIYDYVPQRRGYNLTRDVLIEDGVRRAGIRSETVGSELLIYAEYEDSTVGTRGVEPDSVLDVTHAYVQTAERSNDLKLYAFEIYVSDTLIYRQDFGD